MKTCNNCELAQTCFIKSQYADPQGESDKEANYQLWQGWIMCDDELPPKHKIVLIASQASLKHKIEIHTSEIEDDGNWRWSPQYVYAWRPLPKWENNK